jgi:hypothetical protein
VSGKQHVEFHRKVLMRQHLLRQWTPPLGTSAYVPFIGDGDLAAFLYGDLHVYGADLDPERIATAEEALPFANAAAGAGALRVADCDSWPFADLRPARFSVADFDAYAEPYAAFRAFWARAEKHDRLVLFFTDGQRQAMMRVGKWTSPDGMKLEATTEESRPIFNSYLSKYIWPWFEDFIAPWEIVERFRYLRGWMVYWGAVIELG